ncbi:DUF4880 domain-containing protein [Azospirillum brasilense]|nr:DUF4880 domain-containing protein [Azospirillum brasilense]
MGGRVRTQERRKARVTQDKADGSRASGGGADGRSAGAESGAYRHADPIMDEALTWFVARLDSPTDPDAETAFQAWCDADPRHAEAFERLSALSAMPELREATLAQRLPSTPPTMLPARPAAEQRIAKGPDRLAPQRSGPQRSGLWGGWRGALAAGLLLAVVGWKLEPTLELALFADVRTAAGEQREIDLPDRSRLVLDTDSAVALDFAEGRRGVRLMRGQAYFDVARAPSRPFRVTAAFSTVEVTGTAFTVRTEDGLDSVFLERGRVSVLPLSGPDRNGLDQAVALEPGDRVTATAGGLSPVGRADPAVALAWRDGRYVFHDQPFATVVETVRRYYGHPVLLLDDRIAAVRISGNYRLDDPAAALRSLAGIVGARVTELPAGILLLR